MQVVVSSSYSEYERKINNLLQEGNNALAAGNFPTAIEKYESCLRLDPDSRYCNINLATALIDMNESETDEAIKQEHTTKAISTLRHVLTKHPKDGDAAFNLALLLQDSSHSEDITRESATLYQIAVEATEAEDGEDDRWDALANMAAAKQEIGEFLGQYGARRSYERAIVLIEGMAQEYNIYIDRMVNDEDSANTEFDEQGVNEAQIQLNAMNIYLSKLYYGYGTVLSELSGADCLRLMTEESLLIDIQDGSDEESAKQVCKTNAISALRMAVDLNDENIVAQHMLNSMTRGEEDDNDGGKGRASKEFVSALFDDFADTFDEKLMGLGYKVPQLVGEAAYDLLQMSNKETFDSALDAGCGTGLAGRFIRPLMSGPLVGVDLSKKMLELAAECTLLKGCGFKEKESTDENLGEDERSKISLYDKLVSLDLETASLDDLKMGLAEDKLEDDGFDLIVAADVLVYIGDLQKVLTNFARLSNGDEDKVSFLVFSCERIEDEDAPSSGWKLQTSGRYAHSKSYVLRVAEEIGYYLIGYEEIVPRQEKGEDVAGHLFVLGIGGEPIEEEEIYEPFNEEDFEVTYEMTDEL